MWVFSEVKSRDWERWGVVDIFLERVGAGEVMLVEMVLVVLVFFFLRGGCGGGGSSRAGKGYAPQPHSDSLL